ncbi:MAG: dihydrolipoyl dehydrogenase family protein [Oceanidesulfovibrio sp.]
MATYDYDIGIIGAGAAGLTVASGAAQIGAKTLLVEKRDALGGDCLHYGCVPSKTLIKSAQVYHHMKSGPRYGLPPMDPPPVDFTQIRARIRSVIDTIQEHDSVERFCSLGAQVKFGAAVFVDEHAITLHGKTISADKWVIAAGARPGAPPIEGLDSVSCLTNETLFSMDRLPASMIILGAGPVAIEMAQAFVRLGCAVTVVQRSGQILSGEDKDMADMVQAVLESEGVRIITGAQARSVIENGGAKEVLYEKDGAEQTVRAEALLVALGRRANVDTMDLENAGVDFTKHGVGVDSKLRTNQPHIYACGDITGMHQFTHAAGYEGGVVLSNALFKFPRHADYTWMPRATFTDPEFAAMGMTETDCLDDGVEYTAWVEDFAENDRSLAEGYATGRLKLIVDSKERPLGVQIFGPNAGELLGEWAVALNGGVKLSSLASMVHAYPTLAEINKKVASDIMAPKLFGGLVKKGVNFLFNYRGRACEWTRGLDQD